MAIFGSQTDNQSTDNPELEGLEHLDHEKHFKELTEDLYKRNVELAIKNKTLELLRKLYQISILALPPKAVAEKICQTLLESLNLEIAGIFMFSKDSDELYLLGHAASERATTAAHDVGLSFDSVIAPHTYRKEYFNPMMDSNALIFKEGVADIWKIAPDLVARFEQDTHIKTTLLYPLSIEHNVMGVVVLSLNRAFKDLIDYEKESIASFVNVTAVALDRSSLYQELEVTNTRLEDANEKLKKLDQLKSEFMSLATHQIRSPLTAIKGYASLVLEGDYGPLSKELEEVVRIIFNSCEHLVIIVTEFLDVSRIEQGSMKYNKTDFDMKALVIETIDQLKPIIGQAGLDFNFADDEKATYFVNADKNKVKEVVTNLIDNSIKYTPHGNIAAVLNNKDGKITLSIKDTGVGIDKAEIPKLFEKFVRASDANKTNVIGTGLGLYLARQIIEAHGGHLNAYSEGKGRGSTFVIELNSVQPTIQTSQ